MQSCACAPVKVFQDLLWSDPQEKLGWEANPRGAGIKSGAQQVLSLLLKLSRLVESGRGWHSMLRYAKVGP